MTMKISAITFRDFKPFFQRNLAHIFLISTIAVVNERISASGQFICHDRVQMFVLSDYNAEGCIMYFIVIMYFIIIISSDITIC
jgi:hypothetical protein